MCFLTLSFTDRAHESVAKQVVQADTFVERVTQYVRRVVDNTKVLGNTIVS